MKNRSSRCGICTEGETIKQVELFRYLFRKIDVPQEKLAHVDVEGMKDAFGPWAQEAWRGFSRAVLIIDGLDQVFKNSHIRDALTLVNWLAALRNEATLEAPPYNKAYPLHGIYRSNMECRSRARPSGTCRLRVELRLKKFLRHQMR